MNLSWFGPRQSVEELVEQHYAALYRFAYRLCGSAADAEDLTQEAFCQAQRNLAQLRDPARAKSWLLAILRNAYLHRQRAKRREKSVPLDSLPELPEPWSDPLPAIDPHRLQQALAELPEDFRVPLLLFYFEDFSYRDIAEQLQVPIGTVMSRLARAKAHLRGRLLSYHVPVVTPAIPAAPGDMRAAPFDPNLATERGHA